MQKKVTHFLEILRKDPAVKTVSGSTGGHTSFAFAVLKPGSERSATHQVMERLRLKTDENEIAGAGAWLAGIQDFELGEHWRPYQYTLRSDNIADFFALLDRLLRCAALCSVKNRATVEVVNADGGDRGPRGDPIGQCARACRQLL
jgi:multidrug efflux pump